MRNLTMLAMAMALAGLAEATHAQDVRDPGVNARQEIQEQRIKQGVRSGELTRAETRRLVANQRNIRRLERAYKADGQLTRAERRHLHARQNQASRRIHRQKHDAQERPRAR